MLCYVTLHWIILDYIKLYIALYDIILHYILYIINVRCIFVGTWRATPNACNSGLVGGAPQIGVNACTSGLKTVSVQLAQQVCSWSITMESCCQQHIALQTGTTAHWGSRLADQFWKGPVGVTDPHLGDQGPHFDLGGGGWEGQRLFRPWPLPRIHRATKGVDHTFGCVWPAIRKPNGGPIQNTGNQCPVIFAPAMDSSITLHAKHSLTAVNQQQHHA